MKRVATIQDMSCFGKCSITVALPILSAAGVEVCPIPNVVLSTHTGGFSSIARHDLTPFVADTARHWKEIGLTFDAIYVGYLGSPQQFPVVLDFIEAFRGEHTAVIIDPAMGDNGKLYGGCTADFPAGMRVLCAGADFITPNLTEAALLLQQPCQAAYTFAQIGDLLYGLRQIGAKNCMITGVPDSEGNIGVAFLTQSGSTGYIKMRKLDGILYHGAGDMFTSCFVAALMRGLPMEQCIHAAVQFTVRAIAHTAEAQTDVRFGLCFEPCLPDWIQLLNQP